MTDVETKRLAAIVTMRAVAEELIQEAHDVRSRHEVTAERIIAAQRRELTLLAPETSRRAKFIGELLERSIEEPSSANVEQARAILERDHAAEWDDFQADGIAAMKAIAVRAKLDLRCARLRLSPVVNELLRTRYQGLIIE